MLIRRLAFLRFGIRFRLRDCMDSRHLNKPNSFCKRNVTLEQLAKHSFLIVEYWYSLAELAKRLGPIGQISEPVVDSIFRLCMHIPNVFSVDKLFLLLSIFDGINSVLFAQEGAEINAKGIDVGILGSAELIQIVWARN